MTPTHDDQPRQAGRPFGEEPQKLLRVAASQDELYEIHSWLTPRERANALLDAAAVARIREEQEDD